MGLCDLLCDLFCSSYDTEPEHPGNDDHQYRSGRVCQYCGKSESEVGYVGEKSGSCGCDTSDRDWS